MELIVRWGGIVVLAAAVAVVLASGVWRDLTPEAIQRYHARLFAVVAARPAISLGLFVLVCAAVSALCLPGPGLLALIGGALFGWAEGGGVAAAAFTLGALPTFFAFRAAAGRGLAEGGGWVGGLVARFQRASFSTLLAVRLTPVAPIGVVTIAAGLAQAAPAGFVAATFLGCAPAALVYATLGHGLRGVVERGGLLSLRMLADPKIIIPLGILAVVAASAAFVRLRRAR